MALTRVQLLPMVATALMDYRKLVATETSSDGTYFADRLNIHQNTEPQVGTYLVFEGGANPGSVTRVYDSDRAKGRLNVLPILGSPVQAGDVAHQVNLRGAGFTPNEIYDNLNISLRFSYPEHHFAITPGQFVFNSATPYIDIGSDPATDGVELIEFESPNGGWEVVPMAEREGGDGYWVSPYDGRCWINGPWADYLHSRTCRVTLYGPSPLLMDDDDLTGINPEWLVVETCYRLLHSGVMRDPQRFTIAQSIEDDRERLATAIRTRTTAEQATVRL